MSLNWRKPNKKKRIKTAKGQKNNKDKYRMIWQKCTPETSIITSTSNGLHVLAFKESWQVAITKQNPAVCCS